MPTSSISTFNDLFKEWYGERITIETEVQKNIREMFELKEEEINNELQ